MRERIELRTDRIEIAMEGLIRSQSQLLTAQVILTDQIDSLRQGHKDLALAQQKTEAALHHFIEENEKAHQHLDEKMAETTIIELVNQHLPLIYTAIRDGPARHDGGARSEDYPRVPLQDDGEGRGNGIAGGAGILRSHRLRAGLRR